MKKFEGILFCTDLDGTLFSSDKTVSKENLSAIEYFKSVGGLFTVVTGRLPETTNAICELVKPNVPYGCVNGGGIYDGASKKYLWNTCLDDAFIDLVKEIEVRFKVGIQLNTEKGIFFIKENSAMERFRRLTGAPPRFCSIDEVEKPVLKVLTGSEREEELLEVRDFLISHPYSDRFDFIRSERTLFEILPKGVSKGTVLQKIAELLKVDMKKTIAVGDFDNDVSMIKVAGLGFAVANAVDSAKAAADYVTVSNNESAIAAIIDGLDKGIYTI